MLSRTLGLQGPAGPVGIEYYTLPPMPKVRRDITVEHREIRYT